MLNEPIEYFSSNKAVFGSDLEKRIGHIKTVGLAEAIFTGQAPDGGLFMPTHFPLIEMGAIERMRCMPYQKVFVETMKGFFHKVLPEKKLEKIAKEAYTFKPFIEEISNKDYIVRLDEGPTAAFKDYAAQVLFRFTEALMKKHDSLGQNLKGADLLTYIVATSGDTGSAMGAACHKRNKMWMAILHSAYIPEHVSELQAKQMDTLGENIYVIRVKTDFDGCASLASKLQNDKDLSYMNMSSANSVNIGRLLPQITYYFHIYSKIAQNGEKIYFSVPSGNFGNAVAGLFAKRMGLPIKLIVAVNENDVFERFYRTGQYKPAEETKKSPSSAMNINNPSNVRRLVQLYGGQLVDGKLKRKPDFNQMGKDIVAYSVTDEETHLAVKKFYEKRHRIGNLHSTIEPHGAVAWSAAKKFREEKIWEETCYNGKIVTLETAHPGKFPESLQRISITPKLPKCLARLVDIPHGKYYTVENDYQKVKDLLTELYNIELKRMSR